MHKILKEEDLVICNVKKIEGTSIFVEIEGNGEGSIVLSEIAAGRIRNLREYVTINKKIVCKVLNADPKNIQLSFRRVTAKERETILENYKKEKNLLGMLKAITPDCEKILENIKESYEVADFLKEAKINPKIIEKFMPEHEAQKLMKTLAEKKEKDKIVKRTITLSSLSSSGLNDIKEILTANNPSIKINYLGSSKFLIESSAPDFKKAEHEIDSFLLDAEKKAKQKHAFFSTKDKK